MPDPVSLTNLIDTVNVTNNFFVTKTNFVHEALTVTNHVETSLTITNTATAYTAEVAEAMLNQQLALTGIYVSVVALIGITLPLLVNWWRAKILEGKIETAQEGFKATQSGFDKALSGAQAAFTDELDVVRDLVEQVETKVMVNLKQAELDAFIRLLSGNSCNGEFHFTAAQDLFKAISLALEIRSSSLISVLAGLDAILESTQVIGSLARAMLARILDLLREPIPWAGQVTVELVNTITPKIEKVLKDTQS